MPSPCFEDPTLIKSVDSRPRFVRIALVAYAAMLLACGSSGGSEVAGGAGSSTGGSAGHPVDSGTTDSSADGSTPDGGACAPKTCSQLGATCGSAPDTCGGIVNCGSCSAAETCGGGGTNKCGSNECVPKSCVQLDASCGVISDGCSKAMDCGGCPVPGVCGGNKIANQCGCTPKTCAQLGAACGSIPDGCYGKLECGSCSGGKVCGGNGPNQCGPATCTPKTCPQLGASCGFVSDSCEKAIDCGACSGKAICGGGGQLNQCGCTPKSCTQLGASCGEVDDGCKTVDCGKCTAPESCGGAGLENQCGCTCKLDHASTRCKAGACSVVTCDIGWGDCDGKSDNGCETDLQSSQAHCGKCANQCKLANGVSTCEAAACKLVSCNTGFGDCDGQSSNGCESDSASDPKNCGSCGKPCSAINGIATCSKSQCGIDCKTGFGDCDGSVGSGCETTLGNDKINCGGCGNTCSAAHIPVVSCGTGACDGACESGFADCNGNKLADGCESDLGNSPDSCSTCGVVCSPNHMALRTCTVGICSGSCDNGFADCNTDKLSDGCEIDLQNDPIRCGACDKSCSNNNIASPTCAGGMCNGACDSGFGDCNGNRLLDGCETAISSTPEHCGDCGQGCSQNNMASVSCSAGVCNGACLANFADCNGDKLTDGCEADLMNNATRCGNCSTNCTNPAPANAATESCSAGKCKVASCQASYYDQDGSFANGCECLADALSNTCGGALTTTVALDGSNTTGGNITPAPSDEDWFRVVFTTGATCGLLPKIELLESSGLLRMQVFADNCTTTGVPACSAAETGTANKPITTWETTRPSCADLGAIDPTPVNGAFYQLPTVLRVRVYSTAASTSCLPYSIKFSS